MAQLGRWRGTDAPAIGARPGAYVCSPLDERARQVADRRTAATASPRRPAKPTHVHVYLPATTTPRTKTHDSLPARRGRDQMQPELLCRVGQDGETGEFSATGPNDEPLRVANGNAGLEIWRDPPPDGQDAVFGATDPPGAANLDALRRRIAPRSVADRSRPDSGMTQIAAMQRYLDRCYAPK